MAPCPGRPTSPLGAHVLVSPSLSTRRGGGARFRGGPPSQGACLWVLLLCALLVACSHAEPPNEEQAPAITAATSQALTTCVTLKRAAQNPVADAQVSFDVADPSKAGQNFGAGILMHVGQAGSATHRALFRANLASIPVGATIVSGKLELRQAASPVKPVLNVREVLASWSESTVTWNSISGSFSPNVAATFNTSSTADGQLASIDITALVQAWVNGAVNNGIAIDAATAGRASFGTSEAGPLTARPQLVVCYAPASCSNGIQDGGEAGVDCGGPCPACNLCAGVSCSASDACHAAGVCDPLTGACSNPPLADGTPCNDGSACTQVDTCQSGICSGASPIACAPPTVCHLAGVCDPQTGSCTNPVAPDGTACDDGDLCTGGDACLSGTCLGATPVPCAGAPPVVTITSPINLAVSATASVDVSGTLSEPATVTIGQTVANVSGLTFTATVPLHEGTNILAVSAVNPFGATGSASIVVLYDTTPPRVAIVSPTQHASLVGTTTTVTGTVQDLLIGTVDAGDCTVTVNGVLASVANRGFRADNVPVAAGAGTITAVATDRAGNTDTAFIEVTGPTGPSAMIVAAGGDAQAGIINQALLQPLSALVLDNAGVPVAGVPVELKVTRGNGSFGNGARTQTVLSDLSGMASVTFALGSRSGTASDQVSATAVGFFGTALFSADAFPDASGSAILAPVAGNNQRGAAGSLAPAPLAVLLSDVSGNPLPLMPVTFTVMQGGGLVNGATSVTLTTDADGRAYALFVLGQALGSNVQLVQASAAGATPVNFVATAVLAGPPAQTEVSGVVLTNENDPIPNVLVSLLNTNLSALTDAEGRFSLMGAPVGHVHLEVDGTTAGPYPPISFELDLISGYNNAMDRPAYLPLVDSDGIAIANPVSDVVIHRLDSPGLELTVPAGSATFTGGSNTGVVQVIRVHRDKIPMVPPDGTLPSLSFAIMPAAAHFDPPAPIRFPNIEGRAPGEIVTIYSYDHDLGAFVGVGTAQVSEDGLELRSEPGQGIVKGGWHLVPPAPIESVLCVAANKCQVRRCVGCFPGPVTCNLVSQGLNMAGVPITSPPGAPVLFAPTPDSDCYLTAPQSCTPGVPCVADATSMLGKPCTRRADSLTVANPLCGLTGTCEMPTGSTIPVCCPGGAWSSTNPGGQFCPNGAACPVSPGNSVCCANPCDVNGCCQ